MRLFYFVRLCACALCVPTFSERPQCVIVTGFLRIEAPPHTSTSDWQRSERERPHTHTHTQLIVSERTSKRTSQRARCIGRMCICVLVERARTVLCSSTFGHSGDKLHRFDQRRTDLTSTTSSCATLCERTFAICSLVLVRSPPANCQPPTDCLL